MSMKSKASAAGHLFTMCLATLMGPADRGDMRYTDHLRVQRKTKLARERQQRSQLAGDMSYSDRGDESYNQLAA